MFRSTGFTFFVVILFGISYNHQITARKDIDNSEALNALADEKLDAKRLGNETSVEQAEVLFPPFGYDEPTFLRSASMQMRSDFRRFWRQSVNNLTRLELANAIDNWVESHADVSIKVIFLM